MDISKINLKKLNKPFLLAAALEIQGTLATSCNKMDKEKDKALLNINLKKMNKKLLLSNAYKLQKILALDSSKDPKKAGNDTEVNNPNIFQIELQQTPIRNVDEHEIQPVDSNNSSIFYNNDELTDLKYRLDTVENKLYEAEVRINKLEQYTRRENLEVVGIPDTINQDQLENTVLKILLSIGVNTDSYHISACHRLSKNKNQQYANTIVRFTDRKLIYEIFSKKKDLKLSPMKEELGGDIYITENLSPEFKTIFETCKYLKRKNAIHSCWSYNGAIKIKTSENDRPRKIYHYDDIGYYIKDAHKYVKV